MTTIRSRNKQNCVQITKASLQDKRLSFKARGILAYVLSQSDDYRASVQGLLSESDKDGRDSIHSGLRELERLGYLVLRKVKNNLGQFDWETLVIEFPEVLGVPVGVTVITGNEYLKAAGLLGDKTGEVES